MSQSEIFHGVWELQEWSVTFASNGKTRLPFGGQVNGYILYSPEGWMSATLMARDRGSISQDRRVINDLARRLQQDPCAAIDSEEQQVVSHYFLAAQGYISYCGPFEADSEQVHHHVHASLIPQWVGTTLSRRHAFSSAGDMLTLSAAQQGATDRLVWRRQES